MTKLLPGVDIGKMNLDGRNPYGSDSITDGYAGVSVSGGVQDQDIEYTLSLLDPTHQIAFRVRLAKIHFNPNLFSSFTNLLLNFS